MCRLLTAAMNFTQAHMSLLLLIQPSRFNNMLHHNANTGMRVLLT